jgi:hypothetical protein
MLLYLRLFKEPNTVNWLTQLFARRLKQANKSSVIGSTQKGRGVQLMKNGEIHVVWS